MKSSAAASLLLAVAIRMVAQIGSPEPSDARPNLNNGIFQSVANASVRSQGQDLLLKRNREGAPIVLRFTHCEGVGVERDANQWWILPTGLGKADTHANRHVWVLPVDPLSNDEAWHLDLKGTPASVSRSDTGLTVSFNAESVILSRAEARPHSDPFGNRFSFRIGGSNALEDALAAFYWGTMLPSVVERTMAARFPYSSGYVLSTLNVQSYAGSYPAVDHEFQIGGRLAMGTDADLDVVRRMIELQFQLMNDDPEHLYRSPTSVQPSGAREYHIRRDSKDARENAAMFPLTANIEVLEESWHYFEARKDVAWLRRSIASLEHAAEWTIASTDQYGRVWSDVFYEDQVIKDGRETEAQAFAACSFDLLAHMERLLGRTAKASFYTSLSKKLKQALIAPLPLGYWDEEHHRFVDWVDRNSQVHDHIPLLANTLPLTFGYATPAQVASIQELVRVNSPEWERFPSFVAADIAAYTSSEMGTAGPYDLSAAGRYWFWDAAYRASQKENTVLAHQLQMVANEGKRSGYFMGERYDMDHVYYVDGKNDHGAQKYYEYPNVYAAVLMADLLGITVPADADLAIHPHLSSPAEVEFNTPAYAVRYSFSDKEFLLRNLSDKTRRFKVDLSALGSGRTRYRRNSSTDAQSLVVLAPQQEAHWNAVP